MKIMVVKYLLILLILNLCCLILSCEMPSQDGQNENNPPSLDLSPSITITTNNSVLILGDTLWVTINVNDSTLSNGTLDFKDSTVIVFKNLKSTLDTTIMHIYNSVGNYNITSIFTDKANNTTTKQVLVTVSYNSSPKVTLTLDKTTITLGDKISIALTASGKRRLKGILDLGDSTLIYFSNTNNIDTTIQHIYSNAGWYIIKAYFSSDDSSSEASATVRVYRYFSMNLNDMMSWKYHYENSYSYPTGFAESHKGVHEWKVISMSVAEQDTTFTIEETRNDTVHSVGWNSQGRYDTTFEDKNVSQFEIIQSYSKTKFNIPLLNHTETFIIPNNQFISAYPYSTQIEGGAAFNENGLIWYYRESPGGLLTFHESLSLIEYTKK